MSCITGCIPARIDRNPGSRSKFIAAVRSVAITPTPLPWGAVGVLVEQGITDPVPSLNAPPVSHQSQQCFWAGSQAGQKMMGGLKWLAPAGIAGGHLHNPAGAAPSLTNVRRRLSGLQPPGDVAAMADLVIRSRKKDPVLPLELAADLAVERSFPRGAS